MIASKAKYRTPELPQWEGHPLIEALPRLLSAQDVALDLMKAPEWTPADRLRPAYVREVALASLRKYFFVLADHIALERKVATALRFGYEERNPADPQWWPNVRARLESGQAGLPTYAAGARASALGFSVTGLTGTGKTTAILGILSRYPQLIVHRKYKRRPFTHLQVVWIVVQTPYDGSIRQLAINILRAIGAVVGEDYVAKYGGEERMSVPKAIGAVIRVAALHHLGLIVFDEVQQLAKSYTASQRVLDYLVNLINTVGVPVAMIGTLKAREFLSREFHQIRRSGGLGETHWGRVPRSEWRPFVENLWQNQYTQIPVPLTEALIEKFYFLTQGIQDFSVRLFMEAQRLAILDEGERVDDAALTSAFDLFPTTAQAIEILRSPGGNDDLVDDLLAKAARADRDLRESLLEAYLARRRPRGAEKSPTGVDNTPSAQPYQDEQQRVNPHGRPRGDYDSLAGDGLIASPDDFQEPAT